MDGHVEMARQIHGGRRCVQETWVGETVSFHGYRFRHHQATSCHRAKNGSFNDPWNSHVKSSTSVALAVTARHAAGLRI